MAYPTYDENVMIEIQQFAAFPKVIGARNVLERMHEGLYIFRRWKTALPSWARSTAFHTADFVGRNLEAFERVRLMKDALDSEWAILQRIEQQMTIEQEDRKAAYGVAYAEVRKELKVFVDAAFAAVLEDVRTAPSRPIGLTPRRPWTDTHMVEMYNAEFPEDMKPVPTTEAASVRIRRWPSLDPEVV